MARDKIPHQRTKQKENGRKNAPEMQNIILFK